MGVVVTEGSAGGAIVSPGDIEEVKEDIGVATAGYRACEDFWRIWGSLAP